MDNELYKSLLRRFDVYKALYMKEDHTCVM